MIPPILDASLEQHTVVCSSCEQTLFSKPGFRSAWTGGVAGFECTRVWKDVQQGKQNGCPWCTIVDKLTAGGVGPEEMDLMIQIKVGFLDGKLQLGVDTFKYWYGPSHEEFEVHAELGDVATNYITKREIIWQVDTDHCFEEARKCLKECTQSWRESGHGDCRGYKTSMLPTRVIDCQDPARPKLYEPQPGTLDSYITLSYVWGEDQPHKTTSKNRLSYIEGIDPSLLPQTVRDAITCTHKLRERYLWVDSLCIVQDSKTDKRAEIARMRTIFRDSYVTIVAATSRKVSDGFLHDRVRPSPPVKLPFISPDDGRVGTMLVRPQQFRAGLHGEDLDKDPVNTRAWCLEEKLLARRVLIYGQHTLLFACVSKKAENVGNGAKAFPVDSPGLTSIELHADDDGRGGDSSSSEGGQKRLRYQWWDVIIEYTRRNLTRPEDRLVALGGIAEEFQRFWHSSQYLAGLWQHQLLEDMLWMIPTYAVRPRPTHYRAPTWSWASIDGQVRPDVGTCRKDLIRKTPVRRTHCRHLCDVIRCETTLASTSNPYGEVSGGVLEIKAMMKEVWWDPRSSTLSTIDSAGRRKDDFDDEAHRDCDEEYTRKAGKVWAIPVHLHFEEDDDEPADDPEVKEHSELECILVVPQEPRQSGAFRRVGHFQIKFSDLKGPPAQINIQDWVDGTKVNVSIV